MRTDSWLEETYVGRLSLRLERFKRTGDRSWNFRCPLCGDSATSKTKARGYIYQTDKGYRFHCHNGCGSRSFRDLLREVDPNLYSEFLKERLQGSDRPRVAEDVTPVSTPVRFSLEVDPLFSLPRVIDLPEDHPCRTYAEGRRIPIDGLRRLRYCSGFRAFTNTLVPGKFENTRYDEERMIIPFRDRDGRPFGYQGRLLSGDGPRYITISLDDSIRACYNLDGVDDSRTYIVVEGPIDSMFLNNAMAMTGGISYHALSGLGLDPARAIVCYDNEPRNREIVQGMERAIASGARVCVWPPSTSGKDVNEMILNGETAVSIEEVIERNSARGAEALLAMASWRKDR